MKHMIGRNIPSGHVPGGFSIQFGAKRKPRRKYRDSSREVCEAANRVLEKRGLVNEPNMQDSTVRGGFARPNYGTFRLTSADEHLRTAEFKGGPKP